MKYKNLLEWKGIPINVVSCEVDISSFTRKCINKKFLKSTFSKRFEEFFFN